MHLLVWGLVISNDKGTGLFPDINLKTQQPILDFTPPPPPRSLDLFIRVPFVCLHARTTLQLSYKICFLPT